MKIISVPSLLALATWTHLSLAEDNSQLFSQYLGAPTVSPTFDGPSASLQSFVFPICTNYIDALQQPVLPDMTTATDVAQIKIDGLCAACTGLSQSRIDSCCGVSTSVECFDQFGPSGASQKGPTATGATATASEAIATTSATAKASGGNSLSRVSISSLLAMLGVVGLAFL